jgi:hypothetical protein
MPGATRTESTEHVRRTLRWILPYERWDRIARLETSFDWMKGVMTMHMAITRGGFTFLGAQQPQIVVMPPR